MPEFDAYLMVDWSASSRPGQESIWYRLRAGQHLRTDSMRAVLDKLTRTQNGFSALPTGECEHSGKAREQTYRSAMRAQFAGNVEGDFQLCQRLPNIRRRNGAEHGTAFIADNISLIPANNAAQAAAAVRIAKVLMREGCFDGAFEPGPVTHRQSRGPVNG